MSRPLRIIYPGAVYHVMNRGLNRRPIFINPLDYQNFLGVMDQAFKRWKIEVYAFCLMTNHYHICLRTPEPKISRIMRHIDGVFTQRFNRHHHRDGPLFRGRYKAMVLEADPYLSQVVRYIHLNPVKAGMVNNPMDYEWSSHRDYLKKRRKPDWLDVSRVGDWYGSVREFHKYVSRGNNADFEKVYGKLKWPLILGSEKFTKKVRLEMEEPHRDYTRDEGAAIRPGVEMILNEVERMYRIDRARLMSSKRGERNEARQVAMWAINEHGDKTLKEIARTFQVDSWKTVSWACGQVRKQRSIKKMSSQLSVLEKRLGAISQQDT